MPWMYVGRGTPLGNPYTRAKHGDNAIGLYLEWLREQVRSRSSDVMAELRRIEESTHLVCSCAPRPCHADIIATAWSAMRERGML